MSTINRRAREKKQRRNDMLDAAEKLFFSKGYDNVSMNDIANEVELNRATIYLYFENKEALGLAIMLRGVQILHKLVKSQVKNAVYTKKIYAFGSAYSAFFQLYPQYVQIYNLFQSGRFDLLNLKRPTWDEVREIIRLQKEMFNILRSAIKTGIDGQKISSEVDPVYATILIMSALDTMLNPSPILEKELESMDINKYQDLKRNLIQFINTLLYK
jgi:TetR/AcrR family transcriptional regulator